MQTITLNGHKFGKGPASLAASLFQAGGTNDGYYKTFTSKKHGTRGIRLYGLDGKPILALITDGITSTARSAFSDGKHYLFTVSTTHALEYFGTTSPDRASYKAVIEAANA